ncbi:MAG: hypothetical protein ACLPSW_33470 [Roseiarcus sp.]
MDNDFLPPSELRKLGHRFLQDDYKWGVDHLDEWAKVAIKRTRLSNDEIGLVVSYLDSVLEKADDDQLDQIWNMIGASLGTRGGGGGRMLLKTVRDLLAEASS